MSCNNATDPADKAQAVIATLQARVAELEAELVQARSCACPTVKLGSVRRLQFRPDTWRRHWRLAIALMAHRVERRLGRHLTEDEIGRLVLGGDPLVLRQIWLRYGGRLEVRDGALCLSKELNLSRLTPAQMVDSLA